MMKNLVVTGFLLAITALQLHAATYTVSRDGRGEYTSVQAAINKARSGDEVVILDFGVYNEQVTIDSSKNRLTLRSENPQLRKKPTILFKDTVNIGPRNYTESQDQTKINFDMNGAARVLRAQGVTIEGIIFDGGAPAPYGHPAVWENRFPLFSGNAALTLYVSGDIIIRNCEFVNAYYGVYMKDRNEGGIYANANPADLQPQLVVPLSGFGKTGNHLIEQNRIHDNSWGVFIESAWDLGSTIRYNLIYDNNISEKLAERIEAMEGSDNQWGGAMIFKDLLLTPMAIYNNTFYHNGIILLADWQVGGTNLAFNNIFGEPNKVLKEGLSAQALDKALPNRIMNSLYSCQEDTPKIGTRYAGGMQDPETNKTVSVNYTGYDYVVIMYALPTLKPNMQTVDIPIQLSSGTEMLQAKIDWAILPGAGIEAAGGNAAFPPAAKNRWFEMKFKSTDPDDPLFLTPDWDDSLTNALVVDQGWDASGIRDADGTIADIGAIPLGGIPSTKIIVKPKDPVFITGGTSAKINFIVSPLEGSMKNPKIKYLRWIRNIPYTAKIWGNAEIKSIPAGNIIEVPIPTTPLIIGSNMMTVTIPRMDSAYGFFDIIVEGTTENGTPITTNVGFLPYRSIDYVFDVIVKDEAGTNELATVQAGQKVQLWITPRRLDGKPFDAKVDKVSVTLSSNFNLLTPEGAVFTLPGGIQGTSKSTVIFTKVPESGFDGVEVSGMFTNPNDAKVFFAIRGSSKDIRILPGPPEKIAFQDPPSNGVASVDRGSARPVTVQAFDKYDNKVAVATQISMQSTAEQVGKIVESPVMSNETGLATFFAQVTKGDMNDTFPVVATLLVNGVTDKAKLVVGKPRDRLWILYGDTLAFDENAAIKECSGVRVPVTIRVSKDGTAVEQTHNETIAIELPLDMSAYLSGLPDDTVKISEVALVKGVRVIWIQSTARNVANGLIMVYAKDGALVNASRQNINFTPCVTNFRSAAYHADNGFGKVDRAEIWFEKKLTVTEIPDSFKFAWPSGAGDARMVYRSSMIIDPKDSAHITVRLLEPFAGEVTRYEGSNLQLGTYYWWNSLTPDAPSQTQPFMIADSVGPLIASATLIERVGAGPDTLIVAFTEAIIPDKAAGSSLTLIKNGKQQQLEVLTVIPQTARVIKVVIADLLENSPREGDSIRITATGPIADASRNSAHPQNRPVVLTIRKVPADIEQAAYFDRNADGIIDQVTVTFNKKIEPSQVAVRLIFNGDTAKNSFTGAGLAVTDGDAGKSVQIDLPADLFGAGTFSRTAGTMLIRATFTAFTESNVKLRNAEDRAAPVLTEVVYSVGAAAGSSKAPDTVKFKLSENATIATGDQEPLLFIKNSYTLRFLRETADEYLYVVDASSTVLPINNDSAWIQTGREVVKDSYQNTQLNPANRRVRVKIEVTADLELLVGPNPYIPGTAPVCHIQIRPRVAVELIDSVVTTVVIYDKVGNRVKTYAAISGKPFVDILWDATNEHGRKVGTGTYLVIATASLSTGGTVSVWENMRCYAGVGK